MVQYHGGKYRTGYDIAKVIAREVNKYEKRTGIRLRAYIEPFAGMCGVFRHVPELLGDRRYIAGDISESIILMWTGLQEGWEPPKSITEKIFHKLKYDKKGPSAEKAYIGHGSSFNGQYFKGYCHKDSPHCLLNMRDRLIEQAEALSDVIFVQGEYQRFGCVKNCVIYCDPPYDCNTTVYKQSDGSRQFDFDKFVEWCQELSKYNLVLVSEYSRLPGSQQVYKSDKVITIKGKEMPRERLYIMTPGIKSDKL